MLNVKAFVIPAEAGIQTEHKDYICINNNNLN